MSFYLFLSALIGALIAYIAYLDIMAPGHGILVLGKGIVHPSVAEYMSVTCDANRRLMRIAVQLHSVEDAEPRNSTPGTFKFVTYNLFIRPPGIHSNGEDFKVCVCKAVQGCLATPSTATACNGNVFAAPTRRMSG
jgi:hypothetical protein